MLPAAQELLTQAEGLHEVTIALDVVALQVVKQRAALTYELHERTLSRMIFTVCLHVLRQVGNTVRKQGHLAFNRASVRIRLSVLAKDLFFDVRI